MDKFDSFDIFFMKQALMLARKAQTQGEVPVGAVAVVNNEVIAEGFNCPITTNDPTAHAEIIALREAATKINNYRLLDLTLYVTLEPCLMCAAAMVHARIRRLVFGASDPKAGAITSIFKIFDEKTLNHRVQYQGGVLAQECGKILSDFFKDKR